MCFGTWLTCVAVCCKILQRVAAYCSVLQRMTVCWGVLQCVAAGAAAADREGSMCFDVTHSNVTWLLHMWNDYWINDTTHSESGMWFWRGSFHSFVCLHTWHVIFICDMAHSHVKWRIHMQHASYIRDQTHEEGGMWFSTGSFDSFMCIHMQHDSIMCDITHSQGGM